MSATVRSAASTSPENSDRSCRWIPCGSSSISSFSRNDSSNANDSSNCSRISSVLPDSLTRDASRDASRMSLTPGNRISNAEGCRGSELPFASCPLFIAATFSIMAPSPPPPLLLSLPPSLFSSPSSSNIAPRKSPHPAFFGGTCSVGVTPPAAVPVTLDVRKPSCRCLMQVK